MVLKLPFFNESACNVASFPYDGYFGYVGTTLNGRPLLCGGDAFIIGPQRACFTLAPGGSSDGATGSWVQIPQELKEYRIYAEALDMEEGFWVTGGVALQKTGVFSCYIFSTFYNMTALLTHNSLTVLTLTLLLTACVAPIISLGSGA